MKKSRYTERIVGTLKRHQASVKDIELCRVHRIGATTFLLLEPEIGRLDATKGQRLKALERITTGF
jgi:putative transposase